MGKKKQIAKPKIASEHKQPQENSLSVDVEHSISSYQHSISSYQSPLPPAKELVILHKIGFAHTVIEMAKEQQRYQIERNKKLTDNEVNLVNHKIKADHRALNQNRSKTLYAFLLGFAALAVPIVMAYIGVDTQGIVAYMVAGGSILIVRQITLVVVRMTTGAKTDKDTQK